ncbi:MAG: TIGR01244 family sulfur transferase [Lentilitoribacter sp.]
MDIRAITETYSVSEQITVEDVAEIKNQGFKSIVCHRPDDEQPGQPAFGDIAAAAEAAGIKIRHIPVTSAGLTMEAVDQMVDAVEEMDKPMLGYCRSGARSTVIFKNAESKM